MTITTSMIEKALQDAIKSIMDKAVEEEFQEAKKRLEARMPALQSEVAVTVQRFFDATPDKSEAVMMIRLSQKPGLR